MIKKIKKQVLSFSYAIRGIFSAFVTESHMRFHLVAAFYVMFFAHKFYDLSRGQISTLALAIGSVISAELVNTAIERLCDYITKEYSKDIKFIKDVAAGAVLVAAIASVIVAFDILYKPETLRYIWLCILTYPSFAIKLSISAIVCLLFVVIDPKYYINPIKKLFSKKNKGN